MSMSWGNDERFWAMRACTRAMRKRSSLRVWISSAVSNRSIPRSTSAPVWNEATPSRS